MSHRDAVFLVGFCALLPLSAAQVADIDGNDYLLAGAPDTKVTIVYFVTHDCPISNRYMPEIRRICEEYSQLGARCLLAYVDPTITVGQIREHQRIYGIDQATVHDTDRAIVNLAGASVTPEAALFDSLGRVIYRGRIDNLYAALGTPRRRATEHDLRNALDESLAGKAVTRPRTQAVGCFIPFLNAAQEGELH